MHIIYIVIVVLFVFIIYVSSRDSRFAMPAKLYHGQSVIRINELPFSIIGTQSAGCCNHEWRICRIEDTLCKNPVDGGTYHGIPKEIKTQNTDPNLKYFVQFMNTDTIRQWITIENVTFSYSTT